MAAKFAVLARVLGIVAIASIALSQLQAGIGHAAPAAMRTHADHQQFYTLSYPSNWSAVPGAVQGEFAVESPDGNAGLVAVTNSTAEAQAWTTQQALSIFLKGAGQTMTGTPTLKDFDNQGITMHTAIVGIRTNSGAKGILFLVMATHHGRVYFVVGEVANPHSAAGQAEVKQVIASIGSLSLE